MRRLPLARAMSLIDTGTAEDGLAGLGRRLRP
jgi:hypothetical protein